MEHLKGYYSIALPCKPYMKKYLQSLYGKPLIFDRENYFGTSLLGYLQRKFFTRQAASISYRHFDNFSDVIPVHMPGWWQKQTHFPTDIPDGNVIYINKHFEERFEEDLVKFVMSLAMVGVPIKISLEAFCQMHDITFDEDITYEAIKQKHYRAAKNFKKLYCKSVTKKMKVIAPSFSRDSIVSLYRPDALSFQASA